MGNILTIWAFGLLRSMESRKWPQNHGFYKYSLLHKLWRPFALSVAGQLGPKLVCNLRLVPHSCDTMRGLIFQSWILLTPANPVPTLCKTGQIWCDATSNYIFPKRLYLRFAKYSKTFRILKSFESMKCILTVLYWKDFSVSFSK